MWITNGEMQRAHKRWLEVWPCPMVCDWSQFCGELVFPNSDRNGPLGKYRWQINDEGGQRIKLILTPHYKTLLKAMAIRYVQGIFD